MAIPQIIPPFTPKFLSDILFRKDSRIEMFLELPIDKRINLLKRVTNPVREDIVNRVPDVELVAVIEALDPDEAANILRLLNKNKRQKVLELLGNEIRDSLSILLEFDSNTAAGLMTLDYVQVKTTDTVSSVAKRFKHHETSTGRPPVIVAINNDKNIAGFLPGHVLGLADRDEAIEQYIKKIPTISYAARHDNVINVFRSNPHSKVAVLNDKDQIIGIIYSDDVLNILEERTASSLYDFAGVNSEENVTDQSKRKVKFRYKWLIINLGTAFLASSVVGLFEGTISKYVLLAVYMPIVAGMGGNAGTQTLAVLVRGIALGQITLKTASKTLKREIGASLTNGLINGILVAVVVIIKDKDIKLALVLAVAMIINMIVAATFGTLVPLVMAKLNKDPASSATIFITTATDVLGFMTFLGLATIIF